MDFESIKTLVWDSIGNITHRAMNGSLFDLTQNSIADHPTNETSDAAGKRMPSTKEGMFLAYGSLVTMAVLPVFFGSLRSVTYHKTSTKKDKAAGKESEKMSRTDAAMFPLFASCALISLYLVFKYVARDRIDIAVSYYFASIGVFSIFHCLGPIADALLPRLLTRKDYHFQFSKKENRVKTYYVDFSFSNFDVFCLLVGAAISGWYLYNKYWIANNIIGVAFSINGIEMMMLNNMVTGCILLSGLFVYDIFWVFFTDVMVTVAKKIDAPIKLLFPQDLLENGFLAKNFAMLGLGDIVIPGLIIALLLRFDQSLKRKHSVYFYSGFVAYISALGVTVWVMHQFKHAQPALLYIVPACLGLPILVSFIKGDTRAMFTYADHPDTTKKNEKSANKTEKKENKGENEEGKDKGKGKKENATPKSAGNEKKKK